MNQISVARILLCMSSAAVLGSCSWLFGTPGGDLERWQSDAMTILERNAANFGQDADALIALLERTQDELPREAQTLIGTEIDNLARRTTEAIGGQTSCRIDFLGDRLEESFRRFQRAIRLRRAPDPSPPHLCSVVPTNIDLNLPPQRWQTVTFGGYNLDRVDASGRRVRYAVEYADGSLVDIPNSSVGRSTHYLVTLNTSDPSLLCLLYRDGARKLVTRFGEQHLDGQGEVTLTAWSPADSEVRASLGTQTYIPERPVEGDEDFDTGGNDPTRVRVRSQLRRNTSVLEGRLYLRAREDKGDHTRVEGWSPWKVLYRAPDGLEIIGVDKVDPTDDSFAVTSHGSRSIRGGGADALSILNVYIDRGGDDVGAYTRVEATWKDVIVTLRPMRNPHVPRSCRVDSNGTT